MKDKKTFFCKPYPTVSLEKTSQNRLCQPNDGAVTLEYKVGELILVRHFQLSSSVKKQTSLFHKWCGLYKIVDIPHPRAVYLQESDTKADKLLYNIKIIKPYNDSTSFYAN